MDGQKTYHHGDLRAALLDAAVEELAATGLEGFSLRKVAKRAGVSHAAPAHHFKDAAGLLTALATKGFREFVAAQEAREANAAPDPVSRLKAQGLGYIDFARDQTALFRLMFSSDRPRGHDPDLADAADAAYMKLADTVGDVAGIHPFHHPRAQEAASAIWALAHGLGDLVSSGHLVALVALSEEEQEASILRMFDALIPERITAEAGAPVLPRG
ncbi:MAG: TetR/AcrR family transcriptional regulator [Pseudomonadota bacterium]